MASLPTGTLTILFTDIEGSTGLLQRLGGGLYARVLGEHHRLLRSVIAACDGFEIKTKGDSSFAVLPRAADAAAAAVIAQRDLAEVDWPKRRADRRAYAFSNWTPSVSSACLPRVASCPSSPCWAEMSLKCCGP